MKKPLPICLLLLRLSVFIVVLLWAIDKFLRPTLAANLYQHDYHAPFMPTMIIYIIGAFQVLLASCFVIGLKKNITYGLVLVGMAIYILFVYRHYLPPFQGDNLLFFAAWPMLITSLSLFLLRKQDTLFSVS